MDKVIQLLASRGFEVITPGRTEYDTEVPLTLIKKTIKRSYGLICIAFKRTLVKKAFARHKTDIAGAESTKITKEWLTSPYCQIEPAMAYQANLPIIILREDDVYAEGILEQGAANIYIPEFSLKDSGDYFLTSKEWTSILEKWEAKVHLRFEQRGPAPAVPLVESSAVSSPAPMSNV